MVECERILSRYLGDLGERFEVKGEDEDCVLTTPFVNPDNDPIQIKVRVAGDTARFSDMGESVGFLFLHGVDLRPKSRQRWFFDTTLRRLGVRATESELWSEVPLSELSDGLIRMTEAIRSTQHIVMTAKSRSSLAFGEDVEEWLSSNGIEHHRSVDYAGLSGKRVIIDFELRLKPEPILMDALHSETPGYARNLANRVIVEFLEVRDAGTRFRSACLLDDTVEENVWEGVLPLLRHRVDRVGFWEERDAFLESLTP